MHELFALTDAESDEAPEKVVIMGDDGRRFAFYLSALLGHWESLDQDAYEEMIEDYAESRRIDYGASHGLVGARVLEARCFQCSGRTQISLILDRGKLTLAPVDKNDQHSASRITFSQSQ